VPSRSDAGPEKRRYRKLPTAMPSRKMARMVVKM
jgi:hypothetical protein